MRKHLGAVIAVLAVPLLCTGGASAATEVGGDCVANASAKELTVAAFARAGNPFPLSAPAAGVVTRWKVPVEPGRDTLAQRLLVLRTVGKASALEAIDESETELVDPGANEFRTRVPVEPGDRFGLSGFTETFVCDGAPDISWLYKGDVFTGETRPFKLKEGTGAPVTAIVEPDRDGDGYGDETQDRCPQSAAFHRDACSPVRLRIRTQARAHSILVRATADMAVSLQVFGQVGWGFKARGKQPSGHSQPTRLIVGLRGGTKEVRAGDTVDFGIALPRAVERRLSRITPEESLRAEITALATDAEGAIAERRTIVRLRGWKGS